MKFTRIVFALIFAVMGSSAFAQIKIGYTDAELILSFMPEAQQVEQQLRQYEQSLSQVLNVKYSYFETKMKEFQELKARQNGMTAAEETTRREELERLQTEIEQSQADAQNKLMQKREELLAPLAEKIQKAIEQVATEENYTYVFNANAGGTSIMLFGPEQDNITRRVLKKLGITVPETGDIVPPGGSTPGTSGSTGGTGTTPR